MLALIQLHRARAEARFDRDGDLVLLEHQNRSNWNHRAIADAIRLLRRVAEQHRPGPYQLQAAIVACHAEATDWADTDWEQIVLLYDMLLHLAPSPLTRLHRSIATLACGRLDARRFRAADLQPPVQPAVRDGPEAGVGDLSSGKS